MVEIENVTAEHGDTVVPRDVRLSVPDSTVAPLGPNGAGKTTLGLAPTVVDRIFEALRRIAEAGVALLPVERGMDVLERHLGIEVGS